MSEDIVVRLCAPTLAGMKTGSLFSCQYSTEAALLEDLRQLNLELGPKGVRVLPMRYQSGRALIYLYRPSQLGGDLADPVAHDLLSDRGYPCGNCDLCVAKLARRLRESPEFPHEIGLFLGYPPDDVRGFIQHRDADCKCVGYWKVYGDEQRAKRLFRKYSICTEAYSSLYAKGRSVAQLTIKT
ncbi:MAG: DUF3793 family protein [Oscillospiraceae bacterium]|nr:DUF3793 family protein [Oscillospiraceae bacterium]